MASASGRSRQSSEMEIAVRNLTQVQQSPKKIEAGDIAALDSKQDKQIALCM